MRLSAGICKSAWCTASSARSHPWSHAVWPLSGLFHHTQSKTMLLAALHNFAQLPSCRLARSVRIAEGLLLVPASSCY